MKKLVLSLLVCFAWLGALQAQVLPNNFLMYGQVIRTSDNTPVANHQVIVYEMNNTTILWADTLLTDVSGNFNYTVVNGSTIGPNRIFYAKVFDCQNFANIVQQQNNQGTTDFGIYNFEICDFSNLCSASVTLSTNAATITANATSTGTAPFTYQYSLDGGAYQASNIFTNVASGPHTVCANVTDAIGCIANACDSVYIQSPCQNAAGIVNQANPSSLGIYGYATWNGQIVNNASYTWYWGDATPSSNVGPTFQHQYALPGTYDICVTISYNGCVDTYCGQAIVGASSGNCSVALNPIQGSGPSFNFVSTSNGVSPVSYTYYVNGTQVSVGPATYTYTPNAFGGYNVCVVATDNNGCVSTDCDSLFYSNPCQNAAGFVNQTPTNDLNFVGYATWNGQIINNATYTWTWGDGSSSTGGPTTQHDYNNAGVYTVCVEIAYNGCIDEYCQQVTIGNNTGNCNVALAIQGNGPTFNFVSTASGASPIAYQYYVDGTLVSNGPATLAYTASAGAHSVCVTATDAFGCTATTCDSIYYAGSGCSANFTYIPANSLYSYLVTPANQGGQWYGSYVPNPNGLVVFPAPGIYQLCYVMNMNGDSCDYCATIVVGDSSNSCAANFNWYYANNTQTAVVFNNNSFSNNNGTFVSYQWSFGDGTGSTSANPDHQYAQPGWYTVCLTATTANGCTSTYCDSVAIPPANQPCQAAFTTTYSPFPAPSGPGGVYVFNSTADPNLYHVWNINGEQIYTTSATYSFIGSGSFQVCLTVYSNNGCQDSECQTIVATDSTNNGACQSSFVFYPSPNAFEYTFQSTADANLQHVWSINGETATGLSASYVFPGPGSYQVCLSVSGDSCYNSYCEVIYVGGQDSVICNASFYYAPIDSTYFFASLSDQSLIHDWVIDNNFAYQGYDFTYALSPGVHTVCLTVYNGSGCQNTECQTITVNPPNPSCNSSISGTVTYADVNCSICVNDAIALLYQLTPGDSGTVATLVNVTLVNQGAYSFSGICDGQYIVQAMIAPNSANYMLYMPTYGFSQAQWYNANLINVNSSANYTADIALIPVNNNGGNGVIGGGIVLPGLDSVRAIGPVQGIKVYLTTPAGDYVAYTMSDGNGQFTIGNLPLGTYTICADYPGYITGCTQVTLDANNPQITDLEFNFEHATVGLAEETANVAISSLYPNPANNEAFINVELKQGSKLNISIINTMGQIVYSQNLALQAGKQLLNIPVSNLAQGLYTLSITDDLGNKAVTRKLLKY